MNPTKTTEYKRQVSFTRKYQQAPDLFIENILNVLSLEEYQRRICKAVLENDRVVIRACHDLGKTWLMARLSIWFLTMFKNSKVITTAPTHRQVEKLLWSEIRAAAMKSKIPLGGVLNTTDWTINPEWFALGFSPKKESSGGEGQGTQSSFQGFHAPHILVIFDEAVGIPLSTWQMLEGLMTSAHVRFVGIANPTSTSSEFFRCFKDAQYFKISLSCFDSPNLIANGITDKEKLRAEVQKYKSMNDDEAQKYLSSYKVVRPYLLTAKWVVAQTAKWGFEHPLTVSKIFGEFPEAGDNTLVPLGYVELAQSRTHEPVTSERKSIGVDVARFGADSTILTGLHGLQQTHRKELFKNRTTEITGEVINMSREIGGANIIVVDGTGIGSGVVDELIEARSQGLLPKDCEIREVQFGAGVECDGPKSCEHKDCMKAKFVNMKARMFGHLQDDLKDERGLCLIDDAVYLDEIPTILFKYNSKGQMVIESKDEYKKRTGRGSPDNTDSLALANFGRYDDLKIGTFTKDFNAQKKTLAGGLSSKRNW